MILKPLLGGGLFCQIRTLVGNMYLNTDEEFIIDFSDPYFPYKDSIDKCEFHNILTINNNIKLDNELLIFENLMKKQNKIIELLKEYRTTLISKVVTGKIDVRDWVVPEQQSNKEDAA